MAPVQQGRWYSDARAFRQAARTSGSPHTVNFTVISNPTHLIAQCSRFWSAERCPWLITTSQDGAGLIVDSAFLEHNHDDSDGQQRAASDAEGKVEALGMEAIQIAPSSSMSLPTKAPASSSPEAPLRFARDPSRRIAIGMTFPSILGLIDEARKQSRPFCITRASAAASSTLNLRCAHERSGRLHGLACPFRLKAKKKPDSEEFIVIEVNFDHSHAPLSRQLAAPVSSNPTTTSDASTVASQSKPTQHSDNLFPANAENHRLKEGHRFPTIGACSYAIRQAAAPFNVQVFRSPDTEKRGPLYIKCSRFRGHDGCSWSVRSKWQDDAYTIYYAHLEHNHDADGNPIAGVPSAHNKKRSAAAAELSAANEAAKVKLAQGDTPRAARAIKRPQTDGTARADESSVSIRPPLANKGPNVGNRARTPAASLHNAPRVIIPHFRPSRSTPKPIASAAAARLGAGSTEVQNAPVATPPALQQLSALLERVPFTSSDQSHTTLAVYAERLLIREGITSTLLHRAAVDPATRARLIVALENLPLGGRKSGINTGEKMWIEVMLDELAQRIEEVGEAAAEEGGAGGQGERMLFKIEDYE